MRHWILASILVIGTAGQLVEVGAGLMLSKLNQNTWKLDAMTPNTIYNARFTESDFSTNWFHSPTPMMTDTLRLYWSQRRLTPERDYLVIDTRTIMITFGQVDADDLLGDYLPLGEVDPTQ